MAAINDENTVRQEFWPKLGRVFATLPFANRLAAAWYCAFDPATPLRAKTILIGALAYFIMPFDLVPDFLLGLGFTDDMAVLLAAFNTIRTHIKPEHLAKADEALRNLRANHTERE